MIEVIDFVLKVCVFSFCILVLFYTCLGYASCYNEKPFISVLKDIALIAIQQLLQK